MPTASFFQPKKTDQGTSLSNDNKTANSSFGVQNIQNNKDKTIETAQQSADTVITTEEGKIISRTTSFVQQNNGKLFGRLDKAHG